MTSKSKWQQGHPPVRFYAESVEWLKELEAEAAGQSMTLQDLIKSVLSRRNLVAEREQTVIAAGDGNIECCFCHNLLPDRFIHKAWAERSQLVVEEPQGLDRPPSFDQIAFPPPATPPDIAAALGEEQVETGVEAGMDALKRMAGEQTAEPVAAGQ